ncbi:MAG: iron ABC transporter substrate-binding protein [Proteus mirabilis]|uniref:iron ABC transporter substrate-binding protein n=1 Tax=Proteus mirabilis TaxID=584 RepID=UPI0029E31292|nr:iron ABC transporter substrate-binding protein [Proteus mirabilis]HEK0657166.1 iron ABC transporter substrate-binding protein [Proteus mirabilis]HEK2072790.1 iron ABC transporter substrate-binding protein [Proteus mirabilis]
MAIHRRQFLSYLTALAALSALPRCVRAAVTSRIAAQFGVLPTPENIHRVISAGPPTDQLLLALVPEKLLGFSSLNLEKSTLFADNLRKLPRLGRLSGRGSTLSLETLMALEPDIIIDSGNVDETYRSLAKRVCAQTGVPYVLIDGTLKDSPTQLRQTGALLGVAEKAETLALIAEQYLSDATLFASTLKIRPRFYLARGAKGLQTGSKGSIHTEAIELLGFENVADIAGFTGLTDVSPEQLLMWNPEVIITQDENAYQQMMQDSIWKSIQAVKNNKVLLFKGLPFGWLDGPPGINRLIGMRRLQSHFDHRIAKQVTQDLQNYFAYFYHTSLSAEQCQLLMRSS